MAILNRLSKEEIKENFTHYGLMFGFVPVYARYPESNCLSVEVRNWFPEWLMDLGEGVAFAFNTALTFVDPFHVPTFMITITGEIE